MFSTDMNPLYFNKAPVSTLHHPLLSPQLEYDLTFIRCDENRVIFGPSYPLDVDILVITAGADEASVARPAQLWHAVGNPTERRLKTHAVIRPRCQGDRISGEGIGR